VTPETLLELQHVDTAVDQLRHRMGRLPEVLDETTAHAGVAAWEKRRRELQQQIAGCEARIADSETQNETISHHRQRLEGQMKTVIALREAEALTHEIARLNEQRSALDDAELEAMEEMSAAELNLAEHDDNESAVRQTATDATLVADQARAQAQTDMTEMTARIQQLRSGLDPAMLAMYDTMRPQHGGVAVAKLNGLRCEGCHLDLSRAEVDQMKTAPALDMPECPNCGRLLVR
jgi:uncharacterized protein